MSLSAVAIILLFSAVQSIIGVGVLLFGTPTLLLMGYNYHETLYLILPSSILISFMQSTSSSKLIVETRYTYTYTLPMVVVGLLVVTFTSEEINIKYIVGGMLILIGLIRGVPFVKQYLKIFLCRNKVLYSITMGAVHGVSNMGGGMLVVLMSTLHNRRDVILANIAYTYLLFGIIQVITLSIVSQELININAIALALLSLAVYTLLTRFVVEKVSDIKFDSLITLLIFSYGILSFINIG